MLSLKRIVGVTLAALSLAACQSEQSVEFEPKTPVVKTVTLSTDVVPQWSLMGTLQARYQTDLSFRVAGKIAERQVQENAEVKAGELLFNLDDEDYRLAVERNRANLKALQSQVTNADAELKRVSSLLKRNLASQQVVDQAKNQLNVFREQLNAQKILLQETENQLAYSRLYASKDGKAVAILAEAGEVVSAGQPVLSLAQNGDREIQVQVPEERIEHLPKLAKVQFLDSDEVFSAQLRTLSNQADAQSRTWTANYTLNDQASAASMSLGKTARVTFIDDAAAVKVPSSAIYEQGDYASLWQLKDGKVYRVPVTVKRMSQRWAWVEGDLAAVERIVSLGVHQLNEGEAVKESAE
ncbi:MULTISPECIES: efflux RND transporter periplasmic adaptor subunit [Thiomicrorhabdus]|uniref:Efflux RND transporter periplasmic adaptor subunit n=1 Tax=Thiomicrorhabdus heinhorstiae TaxID=2748010 RepID=A0ABS0C457_9GAMM|nr:MULTISPECIES: efflux RND transporter periplasmic adaptor subunit [Thiomicrorhabdus]MBF6058921.1 efflux RND transporter periplasmic adaptor subunit [Thiomicrorhabdus heinhorstiae]